LVDLTKFTLSPARVSSGILERLAHAKRSGSTFELTLSMLFLRKEIVDAGFAPGTFHGDP
jgi:hypothetical protein